MEWKRPLIMSAIFVGLAIALVSILLAVRVAVAASGVMIVVFLISTLVLKAFPELTATIGSTFKAVVATSTVKQKLVAIRDYLNTLIQEVQ